jgi:hypothetical protein
LDILLLKVPLDIFHVQTSEAKSSLNLVSQGRGSGEKLNNIISFDLTYLCYGHLRSCHGSVVNTTAHHARVPGLIQGASMGFEEHNPSFIPSVGGW